MEKTQQCSSPRCPTVSLACRNTSVAADSGTREGRPHWRVQGQARAKPAHRARAHWQAIPEPNRLCCCGPDYYLWTKTIFLSSSVTELDFWQSQRVQPQWWMFTTQYQPWWFYFQPLLLFCREGCTYDLVLASGAWVCWADACDHLLSWWKDNAACLYFTFLVHPVWIWMQCWKPCSHLLPERWAISTKMRQMLRQHTSHTENSCGNTEQLKGKQQLAPACSFVMPFISVNFDCQGREAISRDFIIQPWIPATDK